MLSGLTPGLSAGALLIVLLKVAAVLGAAWLLALGSKHASAAARHGIWSVAVLAVLALPWADRWVPPLHLDLPVLTALVSGQETVSSTPSAQEAVSSGKSAGSADPTTYAVGSRSASGAALREVPVGPPIRLQWPMILLSVWVVGCVLRLVWLALLSLRTAQLCRLSRPVMDQRVRRLTGTAILEMAVHRPIRVLCSSPVSMPVAWGIFRPVIILPDRAADWPDDRLRVVLLHELAHIRRWDYLTALITELACAVYWPVPLVWLARSRMKVEQEQACDDCVLATGTDSLEYADHLLAIARAFYGGQTDLGLAVGMAREASLKHRVRAILDGGIDRRPMRSRRGLTLAAFLACFAMTVAAARGAGSGTAPVPVQQLSSDDFAPRPVVDVVPAERLDLPAPEYVWFEAENGSVSAQTRTDESLNASGAAYLVLSARGELANSSSAGVHFTFDLETTNGYRLWARLRHDERDGATLSVSLDGGPNVSWSLEPQRSWEWKEVRWSANTPAVGQGRLPLRSGTHTLSFDATSGEVSIDRLLVTSDLAFTPMALGPESPGVTRSYQLIEAEAATERRGRLRTPRDSRASAGEYVVFSGPRRGSQVGHTKFAIDVSESGRYIVWGRVTAPDDRSNSLFVTLNDGQETIWDLPERSRGDPAWVWDPISARIDSGIVDPVVWVVAAGRNVLGLRTREDGVRLDALLVTNDLNRRPRGIWPETLPETPANVRMEMESALLQGPLSVGADPEAGGAAFIRVDAETSRPASPGDAGIARLAFDVPQSGIYSLWARTISRGDDQDSFWIRLDDGPWFRWSNVPTSQEWTWALVEDSESANRILQFRLEPGNHVLEIAGREGGLLLDQIFVTNDPLFDPQVGS